jgi:hypothetical protein
MRTITRYAHYIVPAICDLITAAITINLLEQAPIQLRIDDWMDVAVKSREEESHEAAGRLVRKVSELKNCSKEARR